MEAANYTDGWRVASIFVDVVLSERKNVLSFGLDSSRSGLAEE
jgi:hypothetical protein